MHFIFIVLGICFGVGGWQIGVWLNETRDKRRKYKAACAYAREKSKPLLIAGGPWGTKPARRWFNMPAHGNGDVCLDIDYRAIEGHPCGLIATVTHIPFAEKSFGAAFASHLLEHLPTVAEARKALDELNRVADAVYIISPSRQSFGGWLTNGHHLWVWQKGDVIYLKQRGKSKGKQA